VRATRARSKSVRGLNALPTFHVLEIRLPVAADTRICTWSGHRQGLPRAWILPAPRPDAPTVCSDWRYSRKWQGDRRQRNACR
jgi:hypothetical protein